MGKFSKAWSLGFLALLPHAGITSADERDAKALLHQFLGDWTGTATAWYPRDPDRDTREESIEVHCEPALGDSYVECRSVWTRQDGRSRELRTFWTVDSETGRYDILFLYDNWPGKVMYSLDYDPESRTLSGHDTFEGPGGVAAEERVYWRFDGDEILGTEFNRYETDPEGYWAKSFEFVWRRASAN